MSRKCWKKGQRGDRHKGRLPLLRVLTSMKAMLIRNEFQKVGQVEKGGQNLVLAQYSPLVPWICFHLRSQNEGEIRSHIEKPALMLSLSGIDVLSSWCTKYNTFWHTARGFNTPPGCPTLEVSRLYVPSKLGACQRERRMGMIGGSLTRLWTRRQEFILV